MDRGDLESYDGLHENFLRSVDKYHAGLPMSHASIGPRCIRDNGRPRTHPADSWVRGLGDGGVT